MGCVEVRMGYDDSFEASLCFDLLIVRYINRIRYCSSQEMNTTHLLDKVFIDIRHTVPKYISLICLDKDSSLSNSYLSLR